MMSRRQAAWRSTPAPQRGLGPRFPPGIILDHEAVADRQGADGEGRRIGLAFAQHLHLAEALLGQAGADLPGRLRDAALLLRRILEREAEPGQLALRQWPQRLGWHRLHLVEQRARNVHLLEEARDQPVDLDDPGAHRGMA